MKRFHISYLLLILLTGQAYTSEHNLLYFNNIARPMGMGGAYSAVQDSLLSHLYNPGAIKFPDKPRWNVSFDLTRAFYILGLVTEDIADDTSEYVLGALFIGSFLCSVANISYSTDTWFFKINLLDQLISQGPDFPMYSTSANIGLKFRGALTGFQTGISGQIYNLFSTSLPQGYSISWGLFYRPDGDRSPFSLGLFYFHASDDLPWIRRPYEQIMNNTFNLGAAYRVSDTLTLSFDLRNINNFNLDAYYQPHIGIEKNFLLKNKYNQKKMALSLRAGAYYESDLNQMGVSGGIDFRIYFDESATLKNNRQLKTSRYFYVSYTLTREENVPAYDRALTYNHIAAAGLVF